MQGQLDVFERVRFLYRRKWVLLVCMLVAGLSAYTWEKHKPTLYHADAILLSQSSSSQSSSPFNPQFSAPAVQIQDRDVATQIQILESPPVRALVLQKLPSAPTVKGIQNGQTNEFLARVSSHDPKLATDAANLYAQSYIDFERAQSVADATAAATSVAAEVQALQQHIDAVQAEVAQLTEQTGDKSNPNIALLQQQHLNLLQQQSTFQQKLDELNVSAELKQSPAVLVAQAALPRAPYAPRPKRTGALAAAAALVIASGLLFLLDYLDDRIRSRQDIEAVAAGSPTLGYLPKIPGPKGAPEGVNVSTLSPSSAIVESFRSLRTNVQFLSVEERVRSILVTSPAASEGKTTVATNLGIMLGRAGQRVVIVDADLRRPRVHTFFGVDGSRGLSSVVSGADSLSAAIQRVDGEANLRVLPAGPIPANPAELLGTDRARRVLDALRDECDLLIVDTPPTLPVTDAVALSQRVDMTILVVMSGSSKKRQLGRAIQLLRQVNASLAGIVVNNLSDSFGDAYGYGYGYGYGYSYGPDSGAPSGRRGLRRRRSSAETQQPTEGEELTQPTSMDQLPAESASGLSR